MVLEKLLVGVACMRTCCCASDPWLLISSGDPSMLPLQRTQRVTTSGKPMTTAITRSRVSPPPSGTNSDDCQPCVAKPLLIDETSNKAAAAG